MAIYPMEEPANGKILYNQGEEASFSAYRIFEEELDPFQKSHDADDSTSLPIFHLVYCENRMRSWCPYIPDPHSEYVAFGTDIYDTYLGSPQTHGRINASLLQPPFMLYPDIQDTATIDCPLFDFFGQMQEQDEFNPPLAKLDILVQGFASRHPLVFGFAAEGFDRTNFLSLEMALGQTSQGSIVAVWTNASDFAYTPYSVEIPPPLFQHAAQMVEPDFERPPNAQFVGGLLVNDASEEVVLALADRIAIVPFSCFLLDSTLKVNTTHFTRGNGLQTMALQFDKEVFSLRWENLPKGAMYDAVTDCLRWNPTIEQVESHSVTVLLVHNAHESVCEFTLQLTVSVFSQFQLPHSVDRIAVNSEGTIALAVGESHTK